MNTQEAEFRLEVLETTLKYLKENKQKLRLTRSNWTHVQIEARELSDAIAENLYNIEIIKVGCEIAVLKKMLGTP